MLNVHYLPENQIQTYQKSVLEQSSCLAEMKLRADAMGLIEMTKDEAKKIAKKGDCLLIEYKDKYVPFQILKVNKADNTLILQSYYLLENRKFDDNTNVWRDCDLRRYLNSDFKKNFSKEFIDSLITTDVHTEDYITKDDFWILSHEEVGYKDENNWFKPNIGTEAY